MYSSDELSQTFPNEKLHDILIRTRLPGFMETRTFFKILTQFSEVQSCII
jgi:hypothetical protein